MIRWGYLIQMKAHNFFKVFTFIVGWALLCLPSQADIKIDAIGEALDLSDLSAGSYEVVMRAAGNDANDANYGFVYYTREGNGRFKIDTNCIDREALTQLSDANAYTFVLEKTSDNIVRIRENVTGGYMPYYSGDSRGGFSSIGASDNRAGYFSFSSAFSATNTLDSKPAYILTSTLENGLPVNKSNGEFQVGGSSVGLSIQFFRYYSASEYDQLQENLPALYTGEALQTLKTALQSSSISEADKDAAIADFYASANGKTVTIRSNLSTGNYTSGPEYMYLNGTNLSTAKLPDAKNAVFRFEYVSGDTYRLKCVGNGLYVAPTANKSGQLAANKSQDQAGLYRLTYYSSGVDHVALDCINPTGSDATTHYSLHRADNHNVVTWTSGAEASHWTLETPHSVIVKYITDGDVQLPADGPAYYWEGSEIITPAAIDGYDVSPATANVSDGDITFTYSLKTSTDFFQVAKDYNSVQHWYFMSTHSDRYYMQYVDGQSAIPLDNAHRTLPTTDATNSYLWGFVQSGTANRYKIVNKVAGPTKILSNDKTFTDDATGQNVHPLMKVESTLTDNDSKSYSVSRSNNISGANGFYIGCDLTNGTTQYMNRRSGLAYWYGHKDVGSTFIATEASFTNISYVDANGNALRDAISPILPVGTYEVPEIEGYDYVGFTMDGVNQEGTPTLLGGTNTHTLVLRYAQKNYTITYKYYVLDPKEEEPHFTETFENCHFGEPLPTPNHEAHNGLKLVKIPNGIVIGTREYSIYCSNDNYEPTPDPELPARVNIVYQYYYGGKLMKTGATRNVANGDPMPGLDALPEFVSCSAPRGTVHYYEPTVEIPLQVTYTLPFKCFDSFSSVDEWNNLTISGAKNLFKYEEGVEYIQLNETGVKKDDKYLFAFVGDPFNGFRIVNKAAGEGMILSSLSPTYQVNGGKNTGEDSTPHMMAEAGLPDGYNTLWILKGTGSNFFIRRKDDADGYINKRSDTAYSGDVLAFWTGGADAGSTVYINMVDLTFGESTIQSTVPTGKAPTDGSIYRIYSAYTHQNVAGYMVSEQQPSGEELTHNGRMYLTNAKTVRDRSQMWMAVKQSADNAFQLINLESGRYMQVGGNSSENAVTVFLLPTQANPTTYGICNNATGTGGYCALNTNANRPVTSWSWSSNGTDNMGSNWVFEEVDYNVGGEFTKDDLSARVLGFSPYARLESGKYYRLKNENHTSLYMAENFLIDKKVKAFAENALANPYAAVWKIEEKEGGVYTFTNALTTHVIAAQGSHNTQYPTSENAESAKTFFKVEDGGSTVVPPRYAFCPNDPMNEEDNNRLWSLHCQDGGNVLNWNYRDNSGIATASFWRLEEIENMPSEEELEQIYQQILTANQEAADINANRAELSEKIAAYFEDAACSRVQEQFKHLSDASLRVLMADDNLPVAIQNIILSLKNGKWEPEKDKAYNEYIGKFRIADYDPYSDRNAWNSKLRISATCYLTNPTGITVTSGEVVYLFVGEEPKEGAVLNLEIVEDTNAGAAANLGNLHKGLNVFTATATGELFVNYKVADTEKYLRGAYDLNGVWHDPDYLPIKIHIEGGTANGYWDLSRNMTEEDWQWLSNNMFFSDFLHIKGNNTLLCLLTRNCRYKDHIVEAMKVYDFIYTQELKYIGHDGQFNGRYHPSVTIRDSYSGLFWNGSCANLAGHGIDYNSLITAGYWGICHEVAHGIQDVFNLSGLTEVTNNALVQMINHDFGVKSSRGISVKALLEYKNNGDTWIDILRSGNATWATNHLFFQLYLYFEHLGHMPGFMGRVCDKIREWGGLNQHVSDRVRLYNEDYLMYAKACAEVSETDLSEFFDAWGFFGYSEDTHTTNEQDRKGDHIYYIGDYGSVSLRQPSRENDADRQYVETLKAQMKAYTKKAPNILFLNDRLKHDEDWVVSDTCAAAKIDPSVIGKPVGYIDTWEEGDFGMFYDFTGRNEANALDYSIEGNTVTMKGDGLVGVKIYDTEGNLKYIYNTETFTVPAEVAAALSDGSMTLVAALGNDTNLPLAKPSATKHTMVIYNGTKDDTQTYKVTGAAPTESAKKVPYLTYESTTDVPALTGNAMVLLPEDADYFALPDGLKQSNVFTRSTYEDREVWMANSVNLTDKQDFYLPEGDFVVGMTTYNRTNIARFNSVCLPFETQASNYGSGVKTYVLKEKGDNSVTFVETTEVIPAGTFYLVDCGENNATWSLGGSELNLIGSALSSDEASLGSFQNKTIGAGMYKLNSAGTAFGITTEAGKVTAFRGYLNLPEVGGTRQLALSLVEAEETTGVRAIENPGESTAIDLQGRNTLTLERGKTYVINGKKMIVK